MTETKTPEETKKTTRTVAEVPHPDYVLLIVDPGKEKPARNGPIRFPAGLIAVGKKGPGGNISVEERNQMLEFDRPTRNALVAGANEVSWEAYEAMQKNPYFGDRVKKGVIRVVLPEHQGKPSYSTLDFPEDLVAEVIAQSNDEEWLERSINKDDRDGVPQLCRERIQEIKEQTSNPNVVGDES